MKYQVLFSLKNNEKIFKTVVCCSRGLRNEFQFSEVYQRKDYIGSPVKQMSPKGAHVNFASDQM